MIAWTELIRSSTVFFKVTGAGTYNIASKQHNVKGNNLYHMRQDMGSMVGEVTP
jgi:hypothetical protein